MKLSMWLRTISKWSSHRVQHGELAEVPTPCSCSCSSGQRSCQRQSFPWSNHFWGEYLTYGSGEQGQGSFLNMKWGFPRWVTTPHSYHNLPSQRLFYCIYTWHHLKCTFLVHIRKHRPSGTMVRVATPRMDSLKINNWTMNMLIYTPYDPSILHRTPVRRWHH